MRRRTKPRVAWLPKTSASTIAFSDPHTAGFSNVIEIIIGATGVAAGNSVTGFAPVVIDVAQDAQTATTSLSDIQNSGYRLRRIVGKCFVSSAQQATNGPAVNLCAAAFIILRVDPLGVPLNVNLEGYDLFEIENDDSPWIWRREWILQNQDGLATNIDFPKTNVEYGSAADGPHIDQKTARVVMSDERLFFVASVMNLTGGTAAQDETNIFFHVTPRVLASMKTTLGNRRNASR